MSRSFLETCLKVILTGCSLLVSNAEGAPTFDFLILNSLNGFQTGDQICKSRGYDGLAVVNTPESFAYLLEVTKSLRSIGRGVNIGLYLDKNTMKFRWFDGNPVTSDTPWLIPSDTPTTTRPYGRVHFSGRISLENGSHKVFTACGNYLTSGPLALAVGATREDRTPIFKSSYSFQFDMDSYLECVVVCSADYKCRVAAFNSGLKKCWVLGPPTANLKFGSNNKVTSFIRTQFA